MQKDARDNERRKEYWPGVEEFLELLEPSTEIFEIGSAMGRHASTMEDLGFKVQRSDASKAFVDYLNTQGFSAVYYDVLYSKLIQQYQAVYAHAVFLHFPLLEFRKALMTVYEGLRPNGLFCFSMKLGDFEGWREKGLSGKRYFKYWTVKDLTKELHSAGFSILNTFLTEDSNFVFMTVQKN
jgi:SAM-dependent methyltransferase